VVFLSECDGCVEGRLHCMPRLAHALTCNEEVLCLLEWALTSLMAGADGQVEVRRVDDVYLRITGSHWK
jgi:hypothetical protein